jgi:pilus assembly protein CpaB
MNRTLLILSGALLVGGFFSFWLYQQQFRADETGGAMVPVVAAAIDIDLGVPVRAEWLTTKEIPQSYIEDRHLRGSAMRDLVGLPLAQSVHAGEAILRTDLSTLSDSRRTLSGTVPQGQRATTIMVRPTSTFGGLLRPGDRVDVLLTVGSRELPDTWRQVVILENILVLALGQEFEVREAVGSVTGRGDSQEVRFGRATNITLQVTVEQGGIITIARQRGSMSLLLRNPNDIRVDTQHPDILAADILDPARRARFLRRTVAVAAPVAPPAEGAVDAYGEPVGPAAAPTAPPPTAPTPPAQ